MGSDNSKSEWGIWKDPTAQNVNKKDMKGLAIQKSEYEW